MLLALCTYFLWLSTSDLLTVQAKDPDTDVTKSSSHRDLAPKNVDFAFNLYRHLVASSPDKNVFISPVSISMALAMLSLGACGYTRVQLLQGLGFNLTKMSEAEIHQGFRHLRHLLEKSDTMLEMTMGNALFLDRSLELLEPFSADTKHYYDLEAWATDFQDGTGASRQINEYIKNKTQGKIVDLLSKLDSSAMLILVNYIFFKGTWEHPFDPESTREEDFYVNETTMVRVPMMFQSSNIKHLNDQVLPCQLVQLEYMGNGTVFFILPEEGKMDTVIAALSRDTIQRWSESFTRSQVNLYIPKVSLSGAYDLRAILRDMGIADLLDNGADFSGMTREAQPKLSKVVHKAVLQLHEKGLEAAGPAGVTPNVESEPLTFHFNRPFIVMIFDHFTWSSLFLGKVVNPT
ncbi:corticosteroid-binding globulin-like isoform X1 [Vulpes vulpes]|uniref:Corticosteroid-binding globulin n=1 Tax=Vulpes vulpes TaxID=9627 RepID=A0A3Q7QW30_VULVU|nr:corticosteroid-binding globulin-like [Vulpes vulpes]XP_025838380.1 corticosteroid-binding globulin-like [Vulpes vulpes]